VTVQRVTLPNELGVWAPNGFEVRALYHEIFAGQAYLQHGVTVHHGATVFDVGAHVGLFSISLARRYRDLRLFLFEPIPVTHATARRNMALHAGSAAVTVLPYGLAAAPGRATFEYDRFGAMAATMCRADTMASVRSEMTLRDWGLAIAHDFERTGGLSPRMAAWIARAFTTPGLDLLAHAILRGLMAYVELRRRLFLKRIVCPLRSLSEVIAEHGVSQIDVLKIDVEGSELEVLRGIAPEDWPKIRQIAIEAHDLNGRPEQIAALLRERGYRVTVSPLGWEIATLLGLVMLYAVREP
jgi:31-O-methyltransferase